MRLSFLGAAHTVTGSCYLLETNEHKYLIDCGMFQGSTRVRKLNYEDFPFNPGQIDCVLLTHAHIDHCGLVPRLCKEGFSGKVYATKVTCELAQIMLPDSAYIQESDAEILNRKGRRRGDAPIPPLYTLDDAQAALEHFSSVSYGENISIGDNIEVVFRDAGHIMGSAILEIFVKEEAKTTKLVFSGDLGQPHQPILKNPTPIQGADYLIVESTYGDRLHKIYDKETALLEIIQDTMDRGGNLIIPSFAVGRTQTLLYYFYKLWQSGRLDYDIPIILDSPLAIAATRVFMKNAHDFDDDAIELMQKARSIPQFPQVHICESAADSRALNTEEGSAIILSASGMADAGRILHHLKHNLWRPESTILFVGYQAEGSMGRRLIDGIKRVRILGEEVVVRAKIMSLNGFSAHGDVNQMLDWMESMQDPKPAQVFIVHGESPAQDIMRERMEERLGFPAYIPFRGDAVRIHGREFEIEHSNIPSVSVEMEMEDLLKNFDSDYRSFRKRLMQLVIRQPETMETVIRLMQKSQTYLKKLFRPFNI